MKKEGKLPVNARITIDYEKKKPKIKFSYPRKDVVEQNYKLIFLGLVYLLFFLLVYFQSHGYPFIEYEKTYPSNCSIKQHFNGSVIKNISLKCNNGISKDLIFTQHYRTKNKYFNYITSIASSGFSGVYLNRNEIPAMQKIISLILLIVTFLTLVLLIPFIASRPITKLLVNCGWFKKKIPKINAAISGRSYKAIFKKIPENRIIEIPLFENVKLNYNATEDFSKYLKKVEIKEHPFNRVLIKKGKIKKRRKNIGLWYARFYFSQSAKNGKLEVVFK